VLFCGGKENTGSNLFALKLLILPIFNIEES